MSIARQFKFKLGDPIRPRLLRELRTKAVNNNVRAKPSTEVELARLRRENRELRKQLAEAAVARATLLQRKEATRNRTREWRARQKQQA